MIQMRTVNLLSNLLKHKQLEITDWALFKIKETGKVFWSLLNSLKITNREIWKSVKSLSLKSLTLKRRFQAPSKNLFQNSHQRISQRPSIWISWSYIWEEFTAIASTVERSMMMKELLQLSAALHILETLPDWLEAKLILQFGQLASSSRTSISEQLMKRLSRDLVKLLHLRMILCLCRWKSSTLSRRLIFWMQDQFTNVVPVTRSLRLQSSCTSISSTSILMSWMTNLTKLGSRLWCRKTTTMIPRRWSISQD